MVEIKCYICCSIFWIELKYCVVKRRVLKRKKYHISANYTKETVKRGIHCPYCGNILLDKVLRREESKMPKCQTKKSGHPKPRGGRAKRNKSKKGK